MPKSDQPQQTVRETITEILSDGPYHFGVSEFSHADDRAFAAAEADLRELLESTCVDTYARRKGKLNTP